MPSEAAPAGGDRPLAAALVCYVSTEAFSGVTRTMKQARTLSASGARVVFAGYDEIMPDEIRESGFEVVSVPYATRPDASGAGGIARSAVIRKVRSAWNRIDSPRRLAEAVAATGADIVQSVDLPALACARSAARRTGAILVYDSHEMWSGFLNNPELARSAFDRWILRRMERRHAPRADVVLVVSDEMGRRMARALSLQTVVTIYNSPPGHLTAARRTAVPVRLVFHGSIAATKNVQDVALSMAHLRGKATLDIHGGGLTVSEHELQRLVDAHGLGDIVRIHGAFEYGSVLDMLSEYDVEVYAARMIEENFAISLPNKIFDAMCAGLAIAASGFPAIRELFEETRCGACLDPSSVETIADGLQAIVADPRAVDLMKEHSLRAAPRYAWEAQGAKIVELCAELLGERAASQRSMSRAETTADESVQRSSAGSPRFSAVVPAYNAEETLAETLEAVCAQRFADWECVVVDDGSTDDTASIAASYVAREPRIRMISQENRGSGGAYNTGVRAATGVYVVLCSADDVLLPGHLAEVSAFIDREPGYDIYSCNGYYLKPDGSRELVYDSGEMRASLVLSELVRECFYSVGAAYRRSLFDEIGGYRTEVFGEDYDFWLRAMAAGATHRYLSTPLTLHRVSASQKSADLAATYRSDIQLLEDLRSTASLSAEESSALAASIRERQRFIARLEARPGHNDPRSALARLATRLLGARLTHRIARAYRRVRGA